MTTQRSEAASKVRLDPADFSGSKLYRSQLATLIWRRGLTKDQVDKLMELLISQIPPVAEDMEFVAGRGGDPRMMREIFTNEFADTADRREVEE